MLFVKTRDNTKTHSRNTEKYTTVLFGEARNDTFSMWFCLAPEY